MQAHTLPRFHLGRFAVPAGRNGYVYEIDKRTGQNGRKRVKDACTAEDFYIFEDDAGNRVEEIEDMLQKVESASARCAERLVSQPGVTPSADDRQLLALYVAVTLMRTPRMREQLRWLAETFSLAHIRSTYEADVPWQRMRQAVFSEMSDDEAEQFRVDMLAQIDKGNVAIEFPERYHVVKTMEDLVKLAFAARDLWWTVMRAPAGTEYVVGDHAVTMFDPLVSASTVPVGNGLASSPLAESVLPLDRGVAVKLSIGESEEWRDFEVDSDVVDEMNMRSYSWAEREIYGSSQALVVEVRERARKNREATAMYGSHFGGLLLQREYETVSGEYRQDEQVLHPTNRR